MDVNVITLEDDIDYLIVDAFELNDNKYLILVSDDGLDNVVVRKVIEENDKEFVDKLDSLEEYEDVLKHFYDKNRKENSNE